MNCSEKGSCIYSHTNQRYECLCFKGYSGYSCEINLNPCSKYPCLNNSTCSLLNVNLNSASLDFNCECNSEFGYYGDNCANRRDLCGNYSCSNKGVCLIDKTTNRPYCNCFIYNYGDNCEREESFMGVIRKVTNVSTIIALIILTLLYLIIIGNDLANLIFHKRPSKIQASPRLKVYRLKYYH